MGLCSEFFLQILRGFEQVQRENTELAEGI